MNRNQSYRLGVDVGGTFTDVVLLNEDTGEVFVSKVSTVPDDPSEGCYEGIKQAISEHGIDPSTVSFTVHGTTIATNTIIQGQGARCGLMTSEGFRDVLEIAYQTRPSLYDLNFVKPTPLIPRHLCIGIPQRTDFLGNTLVPLDEQAVRKAAQKLVEEKVDAIAIAFLHSFQHPDDERRAAEIVRESYPHMPLVLSSTVCPEFREYPRTSTTVINAVLLPRVGQYIERFRDKLKSQGCPGNLYLMTSAGGMMSADSAKQLPVNLIESGPAAGVIAAAVAGSESGYEDILALDIGGTTAKAALLPHGEPLLINEFEVGEQAVASATAPRGRGYPVRTPVIGLVEIGAGGGSIACIDPGGALTVGPESAGADPGPACYGRGGTRPTITAACLVLGRIDPSYFLGGRMTLQPDLARKAIDEYVAQHLNLRVEQAALAIVDVAVIKLAAAMHQVSIGQGIDPRGYLICASGGAGPMLASDIAIALGAKGVLVPPQPGVHSAIGLLSTDMRHEVVRTFAKDLDETSLEELYSALDNLAQSVSSLFQNEKLASGEIIYTRIVDTCYVGQSFELQIRIPEETENYELTNLRDEFHRAHKQAYGFANPNESIRIVNLRVTAVGRVSRPRIAHLEQRSDPEGRAIRGAIKGTRSVFCKRDEEPLKMLVYERTKLLAGDSIPGPAIVEQPDTTICISAGSRGNVDLFGNIIITSEKP